VTKTKTKIQQIFVN